MKPLIKADILQLYVGKRFGRLTVISEEVSANGNWFVCSCDCGNQIRSRKHSILKGLTKSCGCLHSEIAKSVNSKPYDTTTRLYRIWTHMRGRCYTKSDKKYKNYGGRGIKICSDWNDFSNFESWAYSNGYNDNLTIERIDVNGDYEPDNCTWISVSAQTANKTTSHYFKYHNKIYSLKELVNIFDKSYKYLHRELITNNKYKDYNLEKATYIDYINQK